MIDDVYRAVESALRSADEPVTCVDLMEQTAVRQAAVEEFGSDIQQATNKMSDVLGFLWRRGVINRHPAPRGGSSKARYAYSWPTQPKSIPAPISRPSQAGDKEKMTIRELDGKVVVELANVVITIKTR